MSKYKESDWWRGLKEAEKLTEEGFEREGNLWSLWLSEGYIVTVPCRKTKYRIGMDDYLEHRKLNREIYNV